MVWTATYRPEASPKMLSIVSAAAMAFTDVLMVPLVFQANEFHVSEVCSRNSAARWLSR